MADKEKACFIVMPISIPDIYLDVYRDGKEHFLHVLHCLFVPSIESAGYKAMPPIAEGADLIHAEIIKNLEKSDLVLCDMSCLNPNVFFEFGIRTSLNKSVCIVKDEHTRKVPFDTGILNYQEYKSTLNAWELPEEIEKLASHIKASEERSNGQNMLWKYFGLKNEAHPYTGDKDSDSKIDYLSIQIDSLLQKLGDRQKNTSPSYPNIPESFLSVIADIMDLKPEGFVPVDIKPTLNSLEVLFRGYAPPSKTAQMSKQLSDKYNTHVVLTRIDNNNQ
jgi:hypothetical protein